MVVLMSMPMSVGSVKMRMSVTWLLTRYESWLRSTAAKLPGTFGSTRRVYM